MTTVRRNRGALLKPLVVLGAVALLVLLLVAGEGQPAHAVTITVDTTNDEFGTGAGCSVREAVQAANTDAAFGGCKAGSGADTITVLAGTYTLSIPGFNEDDNETGDLDVTADLTINGDGAACPATDQRGVARPVDGDTNGSAVCDIGAYEFEPEPRSDFNGDGKDDLASYVASSGNWWVLLSTGTAFNPEQWATFSTKTGWDPQLIGDFNGDGKHDVVNYHAASGTWWVNRSTGTGFVVEKWATFNTRTGWDFQAVGDFTGDGKDDVVNYHPASGTWWVNVSTGSGFVLQKWATFNTKTGWEFQDVGDFNGDGTHDVVNVHPASGTIWVNRSTGSGFVPERWWP